VEVKCHWSTKLAFVIDFCTGVPLKLFLMLSDQAFPIAAARTWSSLPSEMTPSQCLQTLD